MKFEVSRERAKSEGKGGGEFLVKPSAEESEPCYSINHNGVSQKRPPIEISESFVVKRAL